MILARLDNVLCVAGVPMPDMAQFYPEALADTDSIVVYDPGQALPKNQDSWV